MCAVYCLSVCGVMWVGRGRINHRVFHLCFVLRYLSTLTILSETSKPPLDIFSYILTYMIHTLLLFTLNMEKSIKLNLSKYHFHKLILTCSIDRLYGSLSKNGGIQKDLIIKNKCQDFQSCCNIYIKHTRGN